MLLPRNSSSLHAERLHRQEKEPLHSLHPSSHFGRQLSRLVEDSTEMSRCVEDVLQKSYRKIKSDTNFDKPQRKQDPPRTPHSPFPPQLPPNHSSLQRLQEKVVRLKSRISPGEEGRVETKLQEIMLISNMGQGRRESLTLARAGRHNDPLMVKVADSQLLNSYWHELSLKAKISRSTLLKIKENRVKLLIRENADSQQDEAHILAIKERLNQKLKERREKQGREGIDSPSKGKTILAKLSVRSGSSQLMGSPTSDALPVPSPPKRLKREYTKELVEDNFLSYLRSRRERKTFLGELNKELIEKEDVSKIYTFVKGGYSLDPCDIEGEFISLRGFNETKESFLTLNELYKSIKSECGKGGREPLERSLRSIVQLNELSGKIAPNQLVKLMKQRKVVT